MTIADDDRLEIEIIRIADQVAFLRNAKQQAAIPGWADSDARRWIERHWEEFERLVSKRTKFVM